MKTSIKNLFALSTLIAALDLITADRVAAQTFATLHNFTTTVSLTNSDGANPIAGLILSDNTLYGAARIGGNSSQGTVFAVNTDGTGFTNLHTFPALVSSTNSEGATPYTTLVLSGSILYGATRFGGSGSNGTVFAINTNGSGFTNLHTFNSATDGAGPVGGLLLAGNTLYGGTTTGGPLGAGTVFAINTNGTGFTNLHNFINGSEGANLQSRLILSGSTLYGTALTGGTFGAGTVFALKTNGTGFAILHTFTGNTTNSDGQLSFGGLVLSGNLLYGTARSGGASAKGTVYAVSTNGTGFTNLHSFTGISGALSTNSDGANPQCVLILSNNILYGTTQVGGVLGGGTVFAINLDGTGFTNLHNFAGFPNEGSTSLSGLILSSNTLYGTTSAGGSSINGTVFSLSLPLPQLTIIRSGTNVILSWATNAAGFTLQSAPAVTGTFTNIIPAATSPFTNPIAGVQRFFRLSQ
jgi:uncharacterized repeat protein (TIGR03803 family)